MPSRKKQLKAAQARKKAKRNEKGSPSESDPPGTGATDVCDAPDASQLQASQGAEVASKFDTSVSATKASDAPHASQLQASQGAEIASQLNTCVSMEDGVADVNSRVKEQRKRKRSLRQHRHKRWQEQQPLQHRLPSGSRTTT